MNRKRITPSRRASWRAGFPILVLILAGGGCGGQSARPSDPGEGRKALQAMLDAWKGGQKPDILAQQTPAIHAFDGDWKSGHVLQNYRADDEGTLVGSDLSYSVDLELKTPRGKVTKKTAVYAVTTHPQLMVLRQNE